MPETEEKKCTYSVEQLTVVSKSREFLNNSTNASSENIADISLRLFENLKYSDDEVAYINEATFGQSDNEHWFEMRKGLLTASNFERVCASKQGNEQLVAELMGYVQRPSNSFIDMCCDWGLKKEPKVRKLYQITESKKHRKFKLTEHGLRISREHPFIACSIDGLVSCSCHQEKLIEIKCPFSLRNKHPKEAAVTKGCAYEDGVWKMGSNSPYYHQIQGQLGIYGLQQCDLVIYTNKGYVVIPVYYDDKFFQMMLCKLKMFYLSSVIPEICTSDVKTAIEKKLTSDE